MDNFKMAYVILCHTNPNQVNLLINSLNDENVDFFIHVDKKSSIKSEILKLDNVTFVEDPVEVYWGHFSQIECILRSFITVKKSRTYDFVHIISGQDLPLVSNEEITHFFNKNKGKQFVEYFQLPQAEAKWGLLERVKVYFPKFLTSRSRIPSALRRRYINVVMSKPLLQRELSPLPEIVYKGANWMSITGECLDYILDYINDNPEYVNFFKNSFCGDEIFFQTIILNSPFKPNVINDIKRYVDWKTGPEFPRTLTMEDAQRIQNEGAGKFWGRKFDMKKDEEIIELIKSKSY